MIVNDNPETVGLFIMRLLDFTDNLPLLYNNFPVERRVDGVLGYSRALASRVIERPLSLFQTNALYLEIVKRFNDVVLSSFKDSPSESEGDLFIGIERSLLLMAKALESQIRQSTSGSSQLTICASMAHISFNNTRASSALISMLLDYATVLVCHQSHNNLPLFTNKIECEDIILFIIDHLSQAVKSFGKNIYESDAEQLFIVVNHTFAYLQYLVCKSETSKALLCEKGFIHILFRQFEKLATSELHPCQKSFLALVVELARFVQRI